MSFKSSFLLFFLSISSFCFLTLLVPVKADAKVCYNNSGIWECINSCSPGANCTTRKCTTEEDCIFGTVAPPLPSTTTAQGLFTNVLRIVFFAGGLWAFLNIITAGYQFMNAGGDPKVITQAWGKIWQSLVGLVIIVTSFVLAGIVGFLIFNDPLFMFKAPAIK